MTDAVRIWFQKHTVEGRLPLLDDGYRRHVAAVAAEGTEVRFESLPPATYESPLPEGFVRYGSAEAMFSWFFAAQAHTAERAGYDAYVIGTSQDPGLPEARALASIPVLGYGETAFFTCASLGMRFGVVGFIPELAEPISENIHRYGLERWFAGFEYLEDAAGIVEEALSGNPDTFLDLFAARCTAMARRGAHIVVPGEGLPNEILFSRGVRQAGGLPILDADGLLIRAAEHAVALRRRGIVPPATAGYRFRTLPDEQQGRLFELFAPPPARDR